MKNILKSDQQKFVKDCGKMLLKLGAEEIPPMGNYNLKIQTRIGNLYLKIDDDNTTCYSVFGNFLGDAETARKTFGHWKYNFHLCGTVEKVINEIKLGILKTR